MKKLFSLMTIVALTVPMYGCGDTKKTEDKKTTTTTTDTKETKTDPAPKTP